MIAKIAEIIKEAYMPTWDKLENAISESFDGIMTEDGCFCDDGAITLRDKNCCCFHFSNNHEFLLSLCGIILKE